ncbi:hypothetical protein [Corynebacterium aquatimens]|uniref:Uncharacterized protein n=1 Tax=Corynebacterium aquatimens TaxID=1190508 RepID=A0A931GW01_9CORY|nr:hypothetical protein [Corynebacterium aquatimens]MBG6121936.1 hypothetical protein [Corynebacterium aquatimens]WJY65526.1 hypothetical protein CAQUA_04065 [Corynebacterium aquatimens]
MKPVVAQPENLATGELTGRTERTRRLSRDEELAAVVPVMARREAVVKHAGGRNGVPYTADVAFISLSRDLVSVIGRRDGSILNHQEVGRTGLSTHHLWNHAAVNLLQTQKTASVAEFMVRNASFEFGPESPRGFEVRAPQGPAASWMAHPKTFQLLHNHFTTVLEPKKELFYVTRDYCELFVFDAHPLEIAPLNCPTDPLEYSYGFPLTVALARVPA